MGKNKDDGIDDFGLDDLDGDLDFGDWDSPEGGGGEIEARDPIKQSLGTAARSVSEAVFPKHQRDRIILDALPVEATGVYEGYQDINAAVTDVYSHTKEELLKTQRSLKIQTRQLLPTMKKYLPESITSKVDAWTKPEDSFGQNYDPNTALLDRGMQDVFGALEQSRADADAARVEDSEQDRSDRISDNIKETIGNLKQDKLLEVMIGMAKDTNSSYNLQHSVTVNWQRKTLELSYRQLFALQEIAKLSQSRFERDTPALEAIVKNTALPDYAKEEFGEIQGAMFKRKIAEWISPANFTENFLSKMQDNAKKKVSEALGEGRGLMDLIMGGMQEDDDDMGLEDTTTIAPDAQKTNLTQKGIGAATSYFAKKYINPHRDKLTAKIREKMSANDDVDNFFNKALYNITNLPQIANSAMSDERESGMGSFFKALGAVGITPEYSRERVGLESRDSARLDKAAKFDHRSYLTLNEGLPSWLSKINSSIRAGYGEKTDETYDYTARSFVDNDVVAGRVRDYVGADENRERMRKRIGEVTDMVDDGTMTEKQRKDIGSFIESRISEAKEFNVAALLENSDILDRHMDWDTKDKFTELLRSKAGGKNDKLSNDINGELNAMRGSVNSYQKRVDEMSSQYGEKALVDSGIIEYDREKDTLKANKDLTNIYKDVGKLKPAEGSVEELRAMNARAITSQTPSITASLENRKGGKGQVVGSGLSTTTLTEGLTKTDINEVLYGREKTTLVELIQQEQKSERGIKVNNDALIATLERLSSNDSIDKILKHIKAMDEEGVMMLSGGSISADDKGDTESSKARSKKLKKLRRRGKVIRADNEKGILRRWGSLGADTIGGIGSGIWSGAKAAKDGLKGLRGKVGLTNERMLTIAKSPFKLAMDAGKSGLRGAGAFGKATIGARDIYGADGKVVLSGAQLKAGGYFKKVSGKLKPMSTLEDLKGATGVYDSEGTEILSKEQLGKAGELSYYKDKRWWKVTEVVGGGAGDLLNKVLNMPKNLLGGKDNMARKALRWFKELPDMYVGGKLVIRSNLMREGHYTCEGKVIKKPEDIKGEIKDINGNIVISKADFSKEGFEITDQWGRQVRTPLGRMAGRFGSVFGFAKKTVMGIPANLRKVKDTIVNSRPGDFLKRKIADPITNLGKRIFGKGEPSDKKKGGVGWFSQNKFLNMAFGGGGNKTNDILIHIYKLLNKRMKGKPEPEDWLGKAGGGGSKFADDAVQKAKDKVKTYKDKKLAKLKARKDALVERYGLKGKLDKYRPKNVKAKLLERFKKIGGDAADPKSLRGRFDNRFNMTNVRKLNPMHLLAKAKNGGLKRSLGEFRDGIVSRISTAGAPTVSDTPSVLIGKARKEYQDRMSEGARSPLGRMRKKIKGKGGDSIQDKILGKLSNMNEASQGMWFNTMRKSAVDGGMSTMGLSGLARSFGKRFKFGDKSAGKDWFKFMKRGKGGSETSVGVDANGKPSKTKKKSSGFKWVDMLLSGVGLMFGGLPGAIAGALLRPLGGMLLKVAARGAAGLAAKAAVGFAAAGGLSGMAATAAAGIGTAVAAVGGLPVIVGGAIILGVGWAVYSILSSVETKYLDRMRLAQYGVQDYDDWSEDEAAKVRYLEAELKKYISFDIAGPVTLRGLSSEEAVKLGVGYGIEKDNDKELLSFHQYLQTRFIPLYLNWYAAIRKLPSSPALADIGDPTKVSKKEMQKVFKECKLSVDSHLLRHVTDARKADRGWFKSSTDWVGITSDELLSPEDVIEVQNEVAEAIEAREDDNGHMWGKKKSTVVSNSSVAEKFKALDEGPAVKVSSTTSTVKIVNGVVVESSKSATDNLRFSPTHIGDKKARVETLDALQGLRLKTYGMVNLNPVDVNSMLDLENRVLLMMDSRSGVFDGNIDEVLGPLGAIGDSEAADKIRYWFRNRFLPVYSTYVMACFRYLPAANPNKLIMSGRYLYEIATMVMQTRTEINGILTSVWFVRVLPFDGPVNDDPSSVTEELNTLKKLSKDTELKVDVLPRDLNTYDIKTSRKKYDGSALDRIAEGAISDKPGGGNVMKFPSPNSSTSTLKHSPIAHPEADLNKHYRSIAEGSQEIPDIILAAASAVGVNPQLMLTMAMMESSLNPNAKASTSSAKGLYQFLDATWDGQMKKHGNNYGIPAGTSATDPIASALLGAEFLKANGKVSKSVTGKEPSSVDYYIPHFLGAGGARKFYRAMQKDPNAPAANVMSKEAKANPNIFYKNGKARSFADVYKYFTSKMSSNESYIRKYLPGSGSSATNNVTQMFSNVPAYNDNRRETIVKAKAVRDVKAVSTSTNSSAMAAPSVIYDKAAKPESANISNPLEGKAKEFAKANPNATDDDREAYTEAASTEAAKQVIQAPQISTREDELLSAQLTLQQSMAEELINIRKLLTIALEGKDKSRQAEQVMRDVAKTPKRSLSIEHGMSLVNTKREFNM